MEIILLILAFVAYVIFIAFMAVVFAICCIPKYKTKTEYNNSKSDEKTHIQQQEFSITG